MSSPFGDLVIHHDQDVSNFKFVMLPLLFVVNRIDWTTDEALLYSRIFFVTMQTLNGLLWLYIYQLVVQRNNTTETVRVPPAPFSG